MPERDAVIDGAPTSEASPLAVTERQRLLSRLLAQLAHEIRNPLGSLDVHVQLLEEDLARESPAVFQRVTSRLSVIRTELHRLDGVVRHFLSLAGPSAIEPQSVDLADSVRQVCRLLGADAAEREIELAADLPEFLPPILADPGQLMQALLNLVINAIQAVERGGRVDLVVRSDEPGGVVCIEIRDTGPGIDAARVAAIFEPFYTTKAEGSGLGLWIVQQIVLAHGGSINARNAPEGGALFTVRLPLNNSGGGR